MHTDFKRANISGEWKKKNHFLSLFSKYLFFALWSETKKSENLKALWLQVSSMPWALSKKRFKNVPDRATMKTWGRNMARLQKGLEQETRKLLKWKAISLFFFFLVHTATRFCFSLLGLVLPVPSFTFVQLGKYIYLLHGLQCHIFCSFQAKSPNWP